MSVRRKRRLHIDCKEWVYLVIHDKIEIRDINNKKYMTDVISIPGNEGWTWDDIERAKRKWNALPSVTPGAIKHYIEETILGKKLPKFVKRVDDFDHRQEEFNAKHWLLATHRVLRYKIKIGYTNCDDDFERVDLGVQKRADAVPIEVITELLSKLEQPPLIVQFDLETNEKIVQDTSISIYPRFEIGERVYVVFSRNYAGKNNGYAAYHQIEVNEKYV